MTFQYEISYGKNAVPVYRHNATPLTGVTPIPESDFTGRTNELLAMEIDLEVFGDNFLPSYTEGDNSMVVATDSMKNIIIKEAVNYTGATMEGYLQFLGRHFLDLYEQMHALRLTGRTLGFAAANVPTAGGFAPSTVLFDRLRDDYALASISIERAAAGYAITAHDCGLRNLLLLKTTGSAFTAFVRDGYTTLPERRDRPLFISLEVDWKYTDVRDLLDLSRDRYVAPEQVRDVIRVVFHEFVSESIQHLQHEMGKRLLERFPQLGEVRFDALNRTRDPWATSQIDPTAKVYSDPFPAYGRLTLTMRRA